MFTMDAIKAANQQAGGHFFSNGAMKAFKSKISDTVHEGQFGIYFVTSEDFGAGRVYTVRRFTPETGGIGPVPNAKFDTLKKAQGAAAKFAAKGLPVEVVKVVTVEEKPPVILDVRLGILMARVAENKSKVEWAAKFGSLRKVGRKYQHWLKHSERKLAEYKASLATA